ncbi:DUF805 domain-containing protein [Conservatibacter flavescens]|uniref:DUF805 domain-containing protein n=1 Tax=Conservatibacter flavescens TaxID=28161 RepID=A0A2M8S4M5_9PAST|nr:DUF805 domain-containing protein [Conservatibacter flavescens]PJG86092.1 DUF805 domain-containing protein [Conservatibacter flavescens]
MIWYKGLFSFKGRLNRQGFWIGIVSVLLWLFFFANVFPIQQNIEQSQIILLLSVLGLAVWVCLAVVIKRLHDRGRSGWGAFMLILPILCYISSPQDDSFLAWALSRLLPLFIITLLLLDLGIFKGQTQANVYGEKGVSISFNNKDLT